MNSLSLIVLFHVLTGIHGKDKVANTDNWHCKGYSGIEGLFSCLYIIYHNEKDCMEIIKMAIHSALNKILTDECLVKQSKLLCTKGDGNNSCTKEVCRKVLSLSIESLRNQHDQKAKETDSQNCDDDTGSYTNDVDKSRNEKVNGRGNDNKDDKKNRKEQIFKLGAIVGTSVGITGTIILFLIILITIFVCRRRSKKKKRKQVRTQQSIDQRPEMANIESGTSSRNNEGHNILSTYLSLNTEDIPGQYNVLDPSVSEYEETVNSQLLPEVIRFGVAESDENIYHEID